MIHKQAGGTGTYDDPITVAAAPGQYAKGTRFYIPNLRRYFILEDECASCRGAWLEVWIDGRAGGETGADSCINAITGTFTVIEDPVRDYPVDSGPIYSSWGALSSTATRSPQRGRRQDLLNAPALGDQGQRVNC